MASITKNNADLLLLAGKIIGLYEARMNSIMFNAVTYSCNINNSCKDRIPGCTAECFSENYGNITENFIIRASKIALEEAYALETAALALIDKKELVQTIVLRQVILFQEALLKKHHLL